MPAAAPGNWEAALPGELRAGEGALPGGTANAGQAGTGTLLRAATLPACLLAWEVASLSCSGGLGGAHTLQCVTSPPGCRCQWTGDTSSNGYEVEMQRLR